MGSYPEHERMKALEAQLEGATTLWDHLFETLGLHLVKYEEPYRGAGHEIAVPYRKPARTVFAEAFGFDEDVIEAEKRAMIDELRAAQDGAKPGD